MKVHYPDGWNEQEARENWQVGRAVQAPTVKRIFVEGRTPSALNWKRLEECDDAESAREAVRRMSPYYEVDVFGNPIRGELRIRVETEELQLFDM